MNSIDTFLSRRIPSYAEHSHSLRFSLGLSDRRATEGQAPTLRSNVRAQEFTMARFDAGFSGGRPRPRRRKARPNRRSKARAPPPPTPSQHRGLYDIGSFAAANPPSIRTSRLPKINGLDDFRQGSRSEGRTQSSWRPPVIGHGTIALRPFVDGAGGVVSGKVTLLTTIGPTPTNRESISDRSRDARLGQVMAATSIKGNLYP